MENPNRPSAHARLFLILGALNAALTVILAAVVTHLPQFREQLDTAYASAVTQHQFHALGLLAVGLVMLVLGANVWFKVAGWLMTAGIVLFCFNIYGRVLFGFYGLHALVPWGGSAMIFGWVVFAMGVLRGRRNPER